MNNFLIMLFIQIYLYCLICSLIIFLFGNLTNSKLIKTKSTSIEEFFIGLVILSFLSLLFNFFTSLNNYFNIFFLIIAIYWSHKINFNQLIKKIKISLLISLIGTITLVLDHSNRPDAGLYHLPYVSMLNEHKIIFGSANLHFRFGHISILQYLSAIFNFKIFSENLILIPLVLIYSSTIIFFIYEIFKSKSQIIKFFSFCFLIYTLTSMNRYSGFGNDDPAHMFYFISIIYFLKFELLIEEKKYDNFYKLSIFSAYCFLIKQFYIFIFIFPFLIICFEFNKRIFFNRSNFFILFFLFLWFTKNIFVSGCLLYPVSSTCIKNLQWTDLQESKRVSLASEAWAKSWPDRKDQSLDYAKYLNTNWVISWKKNHMYVVLKKITPFLLIIMIVVLFNYQKKKKIFYNNNKHLNYLIICNFIFSIFWFLKFPTYRYGAAYIVVFLAAFYCYFFYDTVRIIKYNFKSFQLTILIFISIAIITKNFIRIKNNYQNDYIEYPWPKKNSFTLENKKNINKPFYYNKEIIYYYAYPYSLCMYSKSPCTSFQDKKLIKIKILNYYDVLIPNIKK